jgi:hypothetical protein
MSSCCILHRLTTSQDALLFITMLHLLHQHSMSLCILHGQGLHVRHPLCPWACLRYKQWVSAKRLLHCLLHLAPGHTAIDSPLPPFLTSCMDRQAAMRCTRAPAASAMLCYAARCMRWCRGVMPGPAAGTGHHRATRCHLSCNCLATGCLRTANGMSSLLPVCLLGMSWLVAILIVPTSIQDVVSFDAFASRGRFRRSGAQAHLHPATSVAMLHVLRLPQGAEGGCVALALCSCLRFCWWPLAAGLWRPAQHHPHSAASSQRLGASACPVQPPPGPALVRVQPPPGPGVAQARGGVCSRGQGRAAAPPGRCVGS